MTCPATEITPGLDYFLHAFRIFLGWGDGLFLWHFAPMATIRTQDSTSGNYTGQKQRKGQQFL